MTGNHGNSQGGDEHKATFLAKGVDSLYLYLDCSTAIDWAAICEKAEQYDYGQGLEINGLPFVKVKAWIKSFPICLQHTQFMFFINRRTAFVKVLSLAFELRGFEGVVLWLCRILDRMKARPDAIAWLEFLRVSRLDVFCDFAYAGDFALDQFRTKLKKSGFFQSGENAEAVTIYFGSRHSLLVRLYVKSAEIEHSGKTYLRANWREQGCESARVWRLEFEYHKEKLNEVCHYRELVAFDENTIAQLFSYGVNTFEYVTEPDAHRNLHRKPLHPVWQELQNLFAAEYSVKPKRVRGANIEYRYKRARPWVMSWLAARELAFEDLPQQYLEDFEITPGEYRKALLELAAGSNSVVNYFANDSVEVKENAT